MVSISFVSCNDIVQCFISLDKCCSICFKRMLTCDSCWCPSVQYRLVCSVEGIVKRQFACTWTGHCRGTKSQHSVYSCLYFPVTEVFTLSFRAFLLPLCNISDCLHCVYLLDCMTCWFSSSAKTFAYLDVFDRDSWNCLYLHITWLWGVLKEPGPLARRKIFCAPKW